MECCRFILYQYLLVWVQFIVKCFQTFLLFSHKQHTQHQGTYIYNFTLQLPYFFFFSLTASEASSFHHHVSLCLHGPFDNPHVFCSVYIIIFLICCQCSFTSRSFHFASSALSLTMLLYSSHVISFLNFHTCHLFVEGKKLYFGFVDLE